MDGHLSVIQGLNHGIRSIDTTEMEKTEIIIISDEINIEKRENALKYIPNYKHVPV